MGENPAEVFERHRGMLMGIAYRMLGTVADAEDVVQTAYVRWHGADRGGVENVGAFLRTVVTRLCLDQMESARARREEYVGPWLPEPLVDRTVGEGVGELAGDLSNALMLALERLSPLERAAFLLHDVFGEEFEEVAGVLGRSEAACRQLASRARENVRGERKRYRPGMEEQRRIADAFMEAARTGDVAGLTRVLAEGVELHTDGGGKVKAAVNVIRGRDKIMRFLAAQLPVMATVRWRGADVNGGAGFVVKWGDGRVQTLAFEFGEGGMIVEMYSVSNPEKLRGVAEGL